MFPFCRDIWENRESNEEIWCGDQVQLSYYDTMMIIILPGPKDKFHRYFPIGCTKCHAFAVNGTSVTHAERWTHGWVNSGEWPEIIPDIQFYLRHQNIGEIRKALAHNYKRGHWNCNNTRQLQQGRWVSTPQRMENNYSAQICGRSLIGKRKFPVYDSIQFKNVYFHTAVYMNIFT